MPSCTWYLPSFHYQLTPSLLIVMWLPDPIGTKLRENNVVITWTTILRRRMFNVDAINLSLVCHSQGLVWPSNDWPSSDHRYFPHCLFQMISFIIFMVIMGIFLLPLTVTDGLFWQTFEVSLFGLTLWSTPSNHDILQYNDRDLYGIDNTFLGLVS